MRDEMVVDDVRKSEVSQCGIKLCLHLSDRVVRSLDLL